MLSRKILLTKAVNVHLIFIVTPTFRAVIITSSAPKFASVLLICPTPHWGNTFPTFVVHLLSQKALSAERNEKSTSMKLSRFHEFCDDNIESMMGKYDYVPGINSPYDESISLQTHAMLNTG